MSAERGLQLLVRPHTATGDTAAAQMLLDRKRRARRRRQPPRRPPGEPPPGHWTPDGLKLLAEWEAKLQSYEDIRAAQKEIPRLTREEAEAHAAKAAYLDRCREYLSANRASLVGKSRRIWAMHSEGFSAREIGRRMRCSHTWAEKVVAKFRARMDRQPAPGPRIDLDPQIHFRLSDEENDVLDRWSAEVGLRRGEFARRVILLAGTIPGMIARVKQSIVDRPPGRAALRSSCRMKRATHNS